MPPATDGHPRVIYGFHSVRSRLRQQAQSVREIYLERSDQRAQALIALARASKVRVIEADRARLDALTGHARHQGVAALAEPLALAHDLDQLLDQLQAPVSGEPAELPLLLALDGVQDPHNLGACLRVADAAGVHAVIAPKDRAAGLTPAVAKVASGAAESVPYFMVTNLARTLRELKQREVWIVGADQAGQQSLFAPALSSLLQAGVCWVIGGEAEGLRRLTRELCDVLTCIPMAGSVESLNVSVAAGICLFETRRLRLRS